MPAAPLEASFSARAPGSPGFEPREQLEEWALMHPLNWLDYGLCALALDPRRVSEKSEVQIDGECGLEARQQKHGRADVSFLQLQLKEEVDLMAHCWNISADLYSPAKDLHHCEAPQSVRTFTAKRRAFPTSPKATSRRVPSWCVGRETMCCPSTSIAPMAEGPVITRSFTPCTPFLESRIANSRTPSRDSGPSSAYRHPFKCYIPWNRQSWQLTCSDRFLMNPVDEDSSIKAMQSATLLGVVEAMHESVCLFSARLKGSLPAHCSCESSDWSSFVEYHEDHGSQYEAAIEDFDETVLQQVDDLTKVDRPMYQAAVKRFIGDLGQVERKFGTKILCDAQREKLTQLAQL
ncbi:unnamed protein product [Effrenium voratum]|uniref:Uncharacterized protein n=1 Tax=Effrenium voratum TaxID=2562239 RepID=A0AA36JC38_9DINO|nr:unnamed protein product [Effrenium voratum]